MSSIVFHIVPSYINQSTSQVIIGSFEILESKCSYVCVVEYGDNLAGDLVGVKLDLTTNSPNTISICIKCININYPYIMLKRKFQWYKRTSPSHIRNNLICTLLKVVAHETVRTCPERATTTLAIRTLLYFKLSLAHSSLDFLLKLAM